MPQKILLLGEGGLGVSWKGRGGSANFVFMGVGICPTNSIPKGLLCYNYFLGNIISCNLD